MKKYRILLSMGTIFAILLLLTFSVFHSRLTNEEDKQKLQNSQAIKGVETLKQDVYDILLRGSARPENGEITVEEAAEIGLNEYMKVHSDEVKGYKVEMVFLDGVLKKTGSWSGHIISKDGSNKFEFLVDGKTGNVNY